MTGNVKTDTLIKHILGYNLPWQRVKAFSDSTSIQHIILLELGLGDRSKNSYLCIFWLICGIRYISLYFLCYCIWIKKSVFYTHTHTHTHTWVTLDGTKFPSNESTSKEKSGKNPTCFAALSNVANQRHIC